MALTEEELAQYNQTIRGQTSSRVAPMPGYGGASDFGSQQAQQGEATMAAQAQDDALKVEQAKPKVKRTIEKKSNGKKIDTSTNESGKITETSQNGQVTSVKVTTNDAEADPIEPSARFQTPQRNWGNMDYTPAKKFVDMLYGSNLAEGSVDPLEAETQRAAQAFQLNQGAEKMDRTARRDVVADDRAALQDALSARKQNEAERATTYGETYGEKRDKINDAYREKLLALQGKLKRRGGGGGGGGSKGGSKGGGDSDDLGIKGMKGAEVKALSAAEEANAFEQSYKDYADAGIKDGFDPTSRTDWENYGIIPDSLKGEHRRGINAAMKGWTEKVLRLVSGAAIAEHEYENYEQIYWPSRGDTPKIIRSKAAARGRRLDSLLTIAKLTGKEKERFQAKEYQKILADKKLYGGGGDEEIPDDDSDLDAEDAADDARLKELEGL